MDIIKALIEFTKNLAVRISIKTIILWVAVCFTLYTPAKTEPLRANADVQCGETSVPLQYTCAIQLYERSSGKPISGAEILINADMPDMPMAHNIRPVIAMENETLGSYRATILLEMPGRWMLRLTISGPLRDIVVVEVNLGGDSDSGIPPHQSHKHH